MTRPIDNPGFSLHACVWKSVCELIDGGIADYLAPLDCSLAHAALLAPIRAGDVLHLNSAVKTLLRDSDAPFDFDRHEADGTFADRLHAGWVMQFTRLHETDGPRLFAEWVTAYQQQEQVVPAWHTALEVNYGAKIIGACTAAVEKRTDLVMVWRL